MRNSINPNVGEWNTQKNLQNAYHLLVPHTRTLAHSHTKAGARWHPTHSHEQPNAITSSPLIYFPSVIRTQRQQCQQCHNTSPCTASKHISVRNAKRSISIAFLFILFPFLSFHRSACWCCRCHRCHCNCILANAITHPMSERPFCYFKSENERIQYLQQQQQQKCKFT